MNRNIYQGGYEDAITEIPTNYTPTPRNLSWMARYEANTMVERAILDSGRDKLSAQLAKGSMENIGMLAMTADQLASMNPDAINCYRAIIAMYTRNALTRLERW